MHQTVFIAPPPAATPPQKSPGIATKRAPLGFRATLHFGDTPRTATAAETALATPRGL
jgi:hypothetical protein